MHRRPFQFGSLRLRSRARGPAVWEFRYRITLPDGSRRQCTEILGTTRECPSRSDAQRRAQHLVLTINSGRVLSAGTTFGNVIDRYIAEERLRDILAGTGGAVGCLRFSTAQLYLGIFENRLRPRWGNMRLDEITPAAVQAWLLDLPAAPKTRANIRGMMHRLFERAMLWGLIAAQRNPISLVEIKGITKRRRMPVVLTPEQFQVIIESLPQPYRIMAQFAQCTGLRVSELIALQWRDFNFDDLTFQVTRAVVKGRVSQVKTEYSEDTMPLDPHVSRLLMDWRRWCPATPEGWLFPNAATGRPYCTSSFARYSLKELRDRLGIRIGWHTFRHTYRSWLDATGAPIGVQQKLMRHAQVSTTMNTYGNALMQSKRDANSRVARLVLNAREELSTSHK
jgi:integrase